MDYSIKTLNQLKPILQGFRKTAGLTQAAMASHLGVTQQTYAQLEANPAAVSVERLFKVLRVLQVGLNLTQTAGESTENGTGENAAPTSATAAAPSITTRTTAARSAKKASGAATGDVEREPPSTRTRTTSSKPQARTNSPAKRSARTATQEAGSHTASEAQRAATKPRRTGKKRENW